MRRSQRSDNLNQPLSRADGSLPIFRFCQVALVFLVFGTSHLANPAIGQETQLEEPQTQIEEREEPTGPVEEAKPQPEEPQPDEPQSESETPSRQPTSPPKPAGTPSKPATNQKQPEQPQNPNEFPPNPLELREPDPLLPTGVPGRPLTEIERQQLAAQLDQLNLQATAQFQSGDRFGAFDTWNRELRLRRFLGLIPEVQALGRVGDTAWKENQQAEVRWITRRLDEILTQAIPPAPAGSNTQPSTSLPVPPPPTGKPLPTQTVSSLSLAERTALLEALGVSYQQVRQPSSAIAAYQQVLTEARQRQDAARVETTLITLGQLHLGWFDYAKASEVYLELLAGAKDTKNQPNEVAYLTQLVYIYEQGKQPEQAIAAEQQLIALYQQLNQPEPIPALRIKIADNHLKLSQLNQAAQNYQLAYQLAQPLYQLGYASDALQKLGTLYRSNDQLDAALKVYDFLVAVEQQAYNYYGMMAAYDQLGQIYVSLKAFPQALSAYQKALELARQLKYREEYFTAQIRQISQQPTP